MFSTPPRQGNGDLRSLRTLLPETLPSLSLLPLLLLASFRVLLHIGFCDSSKDRIPDAKSSHRASIKSLSIFNGKGLMPNSKMQLKSVTLGFNVTGRPISSSKNL